MMEQDFQRREFADGEELALGLADWTAERLREGVAARGVALLIVSGGKSPAQFFDRLSKLDVEWSRVTITLADERRVSDDSPRSNARLVRERLLRNRAEAASFTPLANVRLPDDQELAAASARIANLPMPADVVVLGMGDDGHTASWFPGADGLADAMDPAARQLVAPIHAANAGEPRLTLTGRVILRARAIALEIQGQAKLATFAAALGTGPEQAMPIRAVLRGAADRLTVFVSSRADRFPDPAVETSPPA
jgi:6-phosphogluconolactonase